MSDYRVISGVTQALALAVQRAVSGPTSPVSHATVTTQRPDKPTENDHPRVNIYLFTQRRTRIYEIWMCLPGRVRA